MTDDLSLALDQQSSHIVSSPFSAVSLLPVPLPFSLPANFSPKAPPPVDSNPLDESHLWSVHSTSELVEMLYQMCFFAVGAPLNAIALRNFYKKRSKAHSGEMRLIRLSRQLLIAHLMVLCIYCLWRTHWIWNIHWTLGNSMCKLYSFLSALPFHLWSNMVAAIAIDMLYCIKVPLGSVPNGNRRVSWLIAIAWIFAILCALPMTVFRGTRPIPRTPFVQCYHLQEFSPGQIMAFHFFHVASTFYVPLVVILFCYVSIGFSLRYQGASLRQGNGLANTDQHKRLQQNTKLRFLKATAAIVCTFVLSWLPYQVMALLRVVCEPDSRCEQVASNFNWLQSILLASTCINPFLYRFGIFKSRAADTRKRATHACMGGTGMNGSLCCGADSPGAAGAGGQALIRQMSRSEYLQSSLRSNRSMVSGPCRHRDHSPSSISASCVGVLRTHGSLYNPPVYRNHYNLSAKSANGLARGAKHYSKLEEKTATGPASPL